MSHFRSTVAIINLSLVTALVMQQIVAPIAMAGCLRVGSAHHICQGCGCCEVENSAQLCGCCCGGNGSRSEEDLSRSQHSCCGHEQNADAESSGFAASTVPSDCELVELAPQPLSGDASTLFVVEGKRGLCSTCFCGQKKLPLSAPSPRWSVSINCNEFSSAYWNSTTTDAGKLSGHLVAARGVLARSVRHFSQVVLCNWRL